MQLLTYFEYLVDDALIIEEGGIFHQVDFEEGDEWVEHVDHVDIP